MVRRAGIGATIAASMLFSLLLASNLVLLASSESQARLDSQADGLGGLNDAVRLATASYELGLLDRVQAFLGDRVWSCNTAQPEIETLSAVSASARMDGVSVHAESYMMASNTSVIDDAPLLVPFNGSRPGYLAFGIAVNASKTSPADGMSVNLSTTSVVSLPVPMAEMIDLCASAESVLEANATGDALPDCELPPVQQALVGALGPLSSETLARGLELSATLSLTSVTACVLHVRISVEDQGAAGPDGRFNVRTEQAFSLSLRVLT